LDSKLSEFKIKVSVNRNNNLEPENEEIKNLEALDSAVMLATRMLLSTLQRCADECITSVELEYSLKIGHG
jgi:hypothetical protein